MHHKYFEADNGMNCCQEPAACRFLKFSPSWHHLQPGCQRHAAALPLFWPAAKRKQHWFARKAEHAAAKQGRLTAKAHLRPSRRTFLFRLCSCDLTTGPCITPPPLICTPDLVLRSRAMILMMVTTTQHYKENQATCCASSSHV